MNPEKISQEDISLMAEILSLPIRDEDLGNVHHHFKIIASHAENFLGYSLDEAIEPAPEFHLDLNFHQNIIK